MWSLGHVAPYGMSRPPTAPAQELPPLETRHPVRFPPTIPILETDHLTLRALTPADRAAVFALFADPRVALPTHMAPFAGIAQADELIAFFGRRFAAQGGIRWGLTLTGDDTLIGTAGFPGIDAATYRTRIGYNLAYAHWSRGLATEAVRALVGLGFGQLQLNQIEATTNRNNTGSMRVLAKVGFTEEGILRDYVYWREVGAFYDARLYALLRREYAG
jgi:ribosomal-protein-alanine N-acetyltransferase